MATRRQALTLIGGGIVVAAGVPGCVLRGPARRAREPWARAGSYPDVRRRALSYALLAATPL
ncbi:MAG: twin-arginine translocation pathway signal protein, partial [Gemmatimonadota bacterium]